MEVSNTNKKIISESTTIAKEKMICKDGFCSLPNNEEKQEQNSNNMNLFDPLI
jgi:hypothetical protein